MKARLLGRGFQITSSLDPLGWCLKCVMTLGLTFSLWEVTKGNSNSLCCFGKLLDQQLERFHIPGIKSFCYVKILSGREEGCQLKWENFIIYVYT